MKRREFLQIGSAATAATLLSPGTVFAALARLTIGSGAATSSQYVASVAMAKAIRMDFPSSNIAVLETGGAIDNIRRLSRGEIQLGQISYDAIYQAAQGVGVFEGNAVPDMCLVYGFDNTAISFVVRADSGVKTLKDLNGKRFSPGPRGSSTEALVRESFKLAGTAPIFVPGTVSDAVEAIQNNNLVGYAKSSPSDGLDASIKELMTSTQVRLLSFDKELEAKVRDKVKGIGFVTLPGGLVPGQETAGINNPTVTVSYATRQSLLDDEAAYGVAKAIYEHRSVIEEAYPRLKSFDMARRTLEAETLGVKLHPGAKRFWASVARS